MKCRKRLDKIKVLLHFIFIYNQYSDHELIIQLLEQQSEVAEKREKALRKFATEMEYIKEIAEGARAQAEERHRNGVLKVKQKAKEMRRTGKAPTTCFCF